jgi:hypothetical protein
MTDEPAPASVPSNRRILFGCLAFLLLIPALFLVGIVWNAITGGGGKADAYNACRTSVRASLAMPESAAFEITRSSIDKTEAGFRITGSVKAKNALGGERRVPYTCEATKDGTVLSVNVG